MIVRVLVAGDIAVVQPVVIIDGGAVELSDERVEGLAVSRLQARFGSSARLGVERSVSVLLEALVLRELLRVQLEANTALGLQRATIEDHGRRAPRVLRRLIELAGIDQMPLGSPSSATPSQRHPDWYATTNYNICSTTLLNVVESDP